MVCGNCGSENHRKNSTMCPKRDLYLAELAERQKLLGGGQSSSSSSSSNRMEVDSSQRSQRKRVGENGDGGATGEKIVRYVENDDKDESLEETQDHMVMKEKSFVEMNTEEEIKLILENNKKMGEKTVETIFDDSFEEELKKILEANKVKK